MVRLDILGVLLTLFILGPANWRWSLAAMGMAKGATLLMLVFWRAPLVTYTMGGMFNHVELNSHFIQALIVSLTGPAACYSFVRFRTNNPMGSKGWLKQLLPWSELEQPLNATFAKYAVLSGLINLATLIK